MINQTIVTWLANTPTPVPTGLPSSGPPLSLTLMLVFTGCALSLVLGILVIGFILGTQMRKSEKSEKNPGGKSK